MNLHVEIETLLKFLSINLIVFKHILEVRTYSLSSPLIKYLGLISHNHN